MTDLSSRADIDLLMRRFYGKAMADPLIGYLFTDIEKAMGRVAGDLLPTDSPP